RSSECHARAVASVTSARCIGVIAIKCAQTIRISGTARVSCAPMHRAVLAAIAALAACSQTENDRPATLEYITEAILQPSCAQYTCHSSFRRAKGYAFDTVDAARQSLAMIVNSDDSNPASSFLYQVLTRTIKRMPYDSPLPKKDLDLIALWIMDG